jgi:hypothetical protein
MRRIRISTWVLTAIFLAALVAYLLVKPSSASIIGRHHPVLGKQAHGKQAHSTSPARGTLPGVLPGASRHSVPAASPSPGCSRTAR